MSFTSQGETGETKGAWNQQLIIRMKIPAFKDLSQEVPVPGQAAQPMRLQQDFHNINLLNNCSGQLVNGWWFRSGDHPKNKRPKTGQLPWRSWSFLLRNCFIQNSSRPSSAIEKKRLPEINPHQGFQVGGSDSFGWGMTMHGIVIVITVVIIINNSPTHHE